MKIKQLHQAGTEVHYDRNGISIRAARVLYLNVSRILASKVNFIQNNESSLYFLLQTNLKFASETK